MLIAVLQALRPKQWIKNLFVFAVLVFSKNLNSTSLVITTIKVFVIFCLLSSACYIINDILDAKNDRLHPVKSRRPIASGRLAVLPALLIAIVLSAISLVWAIKISVPLFNITLSYVLLQLLYSFILKKLIIIDALTIAAGFVLRMISGGIAIDVTISKWLYMCTIFLSLFIAFCKRRAEITAMATPESHREVLENYSTYLLDQMISAMTASTVVAYTLYTLSEETVAKFGSQNLVLTIPFVIYGIFRYLYLVHRKQQGGEPENIILSDKPLLLNIFLWCVAIAVIVYMRI